MKTYSGSCHCGEVRFQVTVELTSAGACNCSICGRVGWLMTSVDPAAFQLVSGAGAQTDYQFGRKTTHHLFCAKCGIHAYGTYTADGQEKILINLRCLEGVDAEALPRQNYDGKSY